MTKPNHDLNTNLGTGDEVTSLAVALLC